MQEATDDDHRQALEHAHDCRENRNRLDKNQTAAPARSDDHTSDQTSHDEASGRGAIHERVPEGEFVVRPREEDLVEGAQLRALRQCKGELQATNALSQRVTTDVEEVWNELR